MSNRVWFALLVGFGLGVVMFWLYLTRPYTPGRF